MDDSSSSPSKNFINFNLGRVVKQRIESSDFAPTLENNNNENKFIKYKPNLLTSLVAGATAGVCVDVSLFPLDTLKTRLQSGHGFKAAGGFHGVYKGIWPVLIGSAPVSGIFFSSYNYTVNYMQNRQEKLSDTFVQFLAASVSEVIGATIRVPLEVIKQRKQISASSVHSIEIAKQAISSEGVFGLYRGFVSTVSREIPFAAIQFPLWEYFKQLFSTVQKRPATPLEVASAGAAAGGISAALTTPMDVLKTRTMLADKEIIERYGRLFSYYMLKDIFQENGFAGLFSGIVPRVLWITIGGFIYFGVYEYTKVLCETQPWGKSADFNNWVDPDIKYFNSEELSQEEKEKLALSQTAPNYPHVEGTDGRKS